MAGVSEISSLLETLTTSIDVFKAELSRQGLTEPSLMTSKPHPIDDPAYVAPPIMYEARRLAVSALERLKLLLESPSETVISTSIASAEIHGLRLVAEIGVHDVLEDASNPEEGVDVQLIAKKTKTDSLKLEGVLRMLANAGWFRETRPGYFANNRRSHTLKVGSKGYYLARNMNYYQSNGVGKLPEAMTHPDESFRMSRGLDKTAWNLYAGTDTPFFGAHGWLEQKPGEAEKFGLAMGGLGVVSDNGVAFDVPWADLVKGKDAIVDVGGGQGTLCCSLALAHPEIKQFIVQDLPVTREVAAKYISSKGVTDRVQFEEQNFFEPNKRKGKGNYVFMLTKILHDWSDEEGAKILSRIRECLEGSKSQLLITDPIIRPVLVSGDGPSARESLAALEGQTHYAPIAPPPFIPHDFGMEGRIGNQVNIGLIASCNAFERTYASLEHMVRLAGMRIKRVIATRGYVHVAEVEVDPSV
ncbi:S-adenosyl-L-methionine-dependent methyltransferase [Neolentinus lepideus HHB14362 ss-1]|uniref:S-adenosyl-L-methionine-dependent methyltransferase n=1 Tax=Neolentinus lepideus HHB14362 ss-1 TaxID=1314782 RepID=A0A165UI83_9AGAM|nr:S-adenosyl-L-methionine-dependent methyltransferase [Neolentinus lepideus HHB14362 ss-1]